MTTVRQLLQQKGGQLWYVATGAQVIDALTQMAEHDIGAVLVMDSGQLVGIFSERDFAREVAERGQTIVDLPVAEVMTHPVHYVTPEQTIEECMALMTEKRFRHLPVLQKNTVVGVISIGDVVKEMISDRESIIRGLENYITGHEYHL